MPYSNVVPPGRIFEDYIPIHDGKMILLTPGRQKAEDVSEPPIFARPLTHQDPSLVTFSGAMCVDSVISNALPLQRAANCK